tara:strand:+ start:29856 stop:30725 length:870 start_codon:yes stop_codon:yes gene_type:complete
MRILTFDIEDWFHIIQRYPDDILDKWSNYEVRIHQGMDRIFKILDDNNIKATFFILGYIARKHPEIVKRIHDLGYEVAAHSDMHKVAYKQSRNQYREDLSNCVNSLQDIIGAKIVSYRAPGFSIKKENVWAFEVLDELGIEFDASIFPASREDGGFDDFAQSTPSIIKYNNVRIKEFPMSINTFLGKRFTVTGGGYFRFFPYRLMRKMVAASNYTMTYFHPRDFDSGQPMLDGLSLKRKFKSYYNLAKSYTKLKQLAYDFDFIDLREADKMIDWDQVPEVDLTHYSHNK